MKKRRRKLMYWFGGIVLLLVLIILYVSNKMKSQGEATVLKKLQEANIPIEFDTAINEKGLVRFARSGNQEGKKLLLIHGSPGDWSAWINVFLNPDVQEKYDIVAIDRPGYGGTTRPASGELKEQADAAITVSNHLWSEENCLVVGHSYGGAVVEEFVLNNPNQVAGLVFVAATLSPTYQTPRWYNKLASVGMINSILPAVFQSSNKEMMPLSRELKANEEALAKVDKRIILIHGKKDVLVPFETVDYIKQHLKNVEYIINDTMNHFVPWSHPDLINKAILSFNE